MVTRGGRSVPPAGCLTAAYTACERLARAHYENFPVASRLLPSGMRRHVAAVYAFARWADDVADEGDRSPEERHRLLDDWGSKLRAAVANSDPERDAPMAPDRHPPILVALAHTIRACGLPLSLFEDLLSAFRQDITTHRYATWEDLLEYCRRSANPIGRLVLRIAGYHDLVLDRRSDDLCTALQLTNFWQDLARDWQRGRVYVPAEDCAACRAPESDLADRRMTPEWQCVLRRASSRTRALFASSRPICDAVGGRLRLELRLTWLGGLTVLDRLECGGFDVFASRPALRAVDLPGMLWRALAWRTLSATTAQG